MLVFMVPLFPTSAFAASTSWSVGQEVIANTFDICDEQPGLCKVGNTVYFIDANVYQGANNPWEVYAGPSVDNLTYQYTGNRVQFPNDFGSDTTGNRYWCTGLWVDPSDGKWYTLVHVEYNYVSAGVAGNWPMRRIGYATSSDLGKNWSWGGFILTSDSDDTSWKSGAGGVYDRGSGDPRLFVDEANGFIYIYYFHHWLDTNTGEWYSDTRVARSPISSKMAVGSWVKFYNGAWTQPGIGGHDTCVVPGAINGFVFYDTYLNQYVVMGQKQEHQEYSVFISLCSDLTTQQWSPPEKVIMGQLGYYDWVWDTNNSSMFTCGQSFRYYSSRINAGGWSSRYLPITFLPGSATPQYYADDSLPPMPLPDYDVRMSRLPASALREDFNGTALSGWTKIFGNGTYSVNSGSLLAATDANATLYCDDNAQALANGYMALSFTPVVNNGFAAIFRYQDWNNYAGIYYQNGCIGWENGNGGWGDLVEVGQLDTTAAHRLEISYVGTTITIWLDYNKIYSGDLTQIPTAAGKLALRVSGNTQMKVDDWFAYSDVPSIEHSVPVSYPNLVTNASFEELTGSQPNDWFVWTPDGTASASYTQPGGHSGTYCLVQYMAASYNVFTYQNITGIANGTYILTAWVKSSGAQDTAQMVAKAFGGTDLSCDIQAAGDWTKITIPNIVVTNNQCQIGFYSIDTYPTGGKYILVDDVSFSKQG